MLKKNSTILLLEAVSTQWLIEIFSKWKAYDIDETKLSPGKVRLLNRAKIRVLPPPPSSPQGGKRNLISHHEWPLKKAIVCLSVCKSRWKETGNWLPVIHWVCWGPRKRIRSWGWGGWRLIVIGIVPWFFHSSSLLLPPRFSHQKLPLVICNRYYTQNGRQ